MGETRATRPGVVHRLRLTREQRAVARYRDEERAFLLVLEVLKEWRRDDLFLRVFTLYRSRMRHLRNVAGSLLRHLDHRSASEDLRLLDTDREPR